MFLNEVLNDRFHDLADGRSQTNRLVITNMGVVSFFKYRGY